MSERVRRYRAAALLLAVAGTVTATTAGLLPLVVGAVVCTVLAAGAFVADRTAVLVLTVVGCLAGALALARVGAVDQHDTPPAIVAALLVVVVCTAGLRATAAAEADVALIGGLGLGVVGASAAVGRGAVLPLLLVAAGLVAGLWFRQRAHRSHEPARGSAAPLGRVLAVAVGVGALVAVAAPVPSSAGLHDSLFHRHGGGSDQQAAPTVSPDAFDQNELDLGVRGALSTDPVASVTADAPELWRGAVYQTYDGAAWHKPGAPAAQGDPAAPVVTGEGPSTVPLAATAVDPRHAGTPVRVVVVPAGGSSLGLYAPGVVVSVAAPGQVHLGAAGSAEVRGVQGRAVAYAEQVLLPVTGTAALDRATGADPAGWTALPGSLPQRDRDLAAAVTAGATTRAAKVAAVEAYLRAHERYTLEAPVPAAGHDAVDDFLFRSHEGFCEQFASAETVLLRAVGVPARLVTGFADGTPDGGRRDFSQADAHAWVEVSYGSLGWSTSDPTAGSQLLPASRSLADRVRAFVRSLGHSSARRAAVVGVVVALGLLVLGGLRLVRRRARTRVARGPLAAAFARLERRWPRPPAATPREWAATLPGDLDAAVAAWEAELYAPVGAPREQVARAVAQVDALRRTRRRPPAGPLVLLGILGLTLLHPAPPAVRRAADVASCPVSCLDTAVPDPIVGPTTGTVDYLHTNARGDTYLLSDLAVNVASLPPATHGSVLAVRTPTVVRRLPATASFDPPSGEHELRWTEDGRVQSVSFPIDLTAAQARALVTSWRMHRPR